MARFAETLLPIIHENRETAQEKAQNEIAQYVSLYKENWLDGMRGKLGIFNVEAGDQALFAQLLKIMQESKADFTNTFAMLTRGEDTMKGNAVFLEWRNRWEARQGRQEQSKAEATALMQRSNPAIIPRNFRVEEALDAAVDGDLSVMDRLNAALKEPYDYSAETSEYAQPSEDTSVPYVTYCGT